MNRIEFMSRLEYLLSDISDNEREEALQYYNDYLDDAGIENEEEVLMSLGSPEQVAAIIKNGMRAESSVQGEFNENGFESGFERPRDNVATRERSKDQKEDGNDKMLPKKAGNRRTGIILLIVLLLAITFPAWAGILCTLFGILIAVLAVLAALILVAAILGIVFVVTGIALLFTAFATLLVKPLGALALAGVGLVLIGLGILFCVLLSLFLGKIVPELFRGAVKLFKVPFSHKGGARA